MASYNGFQPFVAGGTGGQQDTTTPNAYRKARHSFSHTWPSGSGYTTSSFEYTLEYPRIGIIGGTNGGLIFTVVSTSGPPNLGHLTSGGTVTDSQTSTSRSVNIIRLAEDGSLVESATNLITFEGEPVPFRPIYDEMRAIFDNLVDFDFRPGEPISNGQIISGGTGVNHQATLIPQSLGLSSVTGLIKVPGQAGSYDYPNQEIDQVNSDVVGFSQQGIRLTLSKRLVPVQVSYADWVVIHDVSQVPAFVEKTCSQSAGIELLDAPEYDDEFENLPGDSKILERYGFGPDVWASGAFGGLHPTCL